MIQSQIECPLSKAPPQPVYTFKEHESLGYNMQSDFLCWDSLIVTGSAASRAYVYSVQTGSLVGVLQTQINPVTLVAACPGVSSFAFTICGMHNPSLLLADVGMSQESFQEKVTPNLEITSEDIIRERVMKMLVKHSRLMVRLAQEHDLVVTSESFGAMLEILLVSSDEEMIMFRRELLDSFSQSVHVTDAELDIRRRLDARKLKDAWKQCFTCFQCHTKRDLVLSGQIPPTPSKSTEKEFNPLDFEVNPKSELK